MEQSDAEALLESLMGRAFYVTEDNEGRRVDRLLRAMWPKVPLSAIMKAIRTGQVRLDAKKTKPEARLEAGQLLQTPWGENDAAPGASKKPQGPRGGLATIYKDESLWLINKPAGLLSQPDEKGGDSVVTRVLGLLEWDRADFRPSAAHRLDRNTTGIIAVALNGKFQRLLAELIRERKIKKIYRAVVSGDTPESGRIDLPLLKDGEKNVVGIDEKGQPALTLFRRIAGGKGFSCVEAELITGRPHQIRAHFSAIGHPVLGDRKYGGGAKAERPLLHAYELTFPKDERLGAVSGEKFTAELPDDMKKYFAKK